MWSPCVSSLCLACEGSGATDKAWLKNCAVTILSLLASDVGAEFFTQKSDGCFDSLGFSVEVGGDSTDHDTCINFDADGYFHDGALVV